jgi:hypothetical protein
MAKEKFIRGKRDECNHDGKYSNDKRLEQALSDESVGEQLIVSMHVYKQRNKLPADIVAYHEGILRAWGVLD